MLRDFDGDVPIYDETTNINAAITTNTTKVREEAPYKLDGTGMKAGIWEPSGIALTTHQEFGGRVINKDETLVAQEKAEKIQEAFIAWVMTDETRVAELEESYNKHYPATGCTISTCEHQHSHILPTARRWAICPGIADESYESSIPCLDKYKVSINTAQYQDLR